MNAVTYGGRTDTGYRARLPAYVNGTEAFYSQFASDGDDWTGLVESTPSDLRYTRADAMSDVTRILSAIEQGDPQAAEQLLPMVYDELRKLASRKLHQEKPGQTLQTTALVHEAYLRLLGIAAEEADARPHWANRRHFFAAAAEAMRRILVENARRKGRAKHGGGRRREHMDLDALHASGPAEELLALHEALEQFALHDPLKAKLVELRFFAGLTLEQASQCLDISLSTADRGWRYARAWLYAAMAGGDSETK